MLQDFLNVWNEVQAFIAPEFRPKVEIKDDYRPYGSNAVCQVTDFKVKAAIFNDKYAVFESMREGVSFVDPVIRLEDMKPDEDMAKRWEEKGLNPSTISEAMDGHYYSTAFFLAESIMSDWQDKLRADGKG